MSCLHFVHETTCHDFLVEEMVLQISPDYDLVWSGNVFGNPVATAYFFCPADVLSIKNTLLLNQTSSFPPVAAASARRGRGPGR